jgi:hypothetical protein
VTTSVEIRIPEEHLRSGPLNQLQQRLEILEDLPDINGELDRPSFI